MFQSIVREFASQWFDDYSRLAYFVARRWTRRLLDCQARSYSASEIDELAQDAICRAYDRFAKRCAREICGESDRKSWVCQCVVRGVRDAIRAKSRFDSLSAGVAVRDDVMNRCVRVSTGFVHGDDDERDALDVEAKPVDHAVQRWELEQLIGSELPADLQPTATYAACGLTQAQSALLQGVTDRTVRNRLQDIRNHLSPSPNPYAVICDALRACLDEPRQAAVA